MKPTNYLSALFRPSALPAGERPPCDFDLISRYFYNCPAEDASHTIDAETTADLDLNAVFERIDLNMMMKMMIGNKLQGALDQIAEGIARAMNAAPQV